MRCLVLSPDPELARILADVARDAVGGEVDAFSADGPALEALAATPCDLALVQLDSAADPRVSFLERACRVEPAVPVVLVLPAAERALGPAGIAMGAMDWVVREHLDAGHLAVLLAGVLERVEHRRELDRRRRRERWEFRSRVMAGPLQRTVAELGTRIRTHLGYLIAETEDLRQRMGAPAADRAPVAEILDPALALWHLHEELLDLSDAVRSLLVLTDLVHRRAGPDDLQALVQELSATLGPASAEHLGLRLPTFRG